MKKSYRAVVAALLLLSAPLSTGTMIKAKVRPEPQVEAHDSNARYHPGNEIWTIIFTPWRGYYILTGFGRLGNDEGDVIYIKPRS